MVKNGLNEPFILKRLYKNYLISGSSFLFLKLLKKNKLFGVLQNNFLVIFSLEKKNNLKKIVQF